MSEVKRVFQFPIEDTEQLVSVVKGLSKIRVDMDVESTPSSIKISVYGSQGKIEEASEKIRNLFESSKSS